MKVIRKQKNSENCFACGVNNPAGPKLEFYEMEDKSLVGLVTCRSIHMSYPNTVHGGVSAALLDETMGRAILCFEPDTWGVTLELNVKYKKPIPFDTQLRVTGRVIENKERVFICEGEILLPDNVVAAYGRGAYFKSSTTGAQDAGISDLKLYLHENEPTEIELPVPLPHPER